MYSNYLLFDFDDFSCGRLAAGDDALQRRSSLRRRCIARRCKPLLQLSLRHVAASADRARRLRASARCAGARSKSAGRAGPPVCAVQAQLN